MCPRPQSFIAPTLPARTPPRCYLRTVLHPPPSSVDLSSLSPPPRDRVRLVFFFLMNRRPRRSPLFPYPTLFRSAAAVTGGGAATAARRAPAAVGGLISPGPAASPARVTRAFAPRGSAAPRRAAATGPVAAALR